jgi:hypothetical protein
MTISTPRLLPRMADAKMASRMNGNANCKSTSRITTASIQPPK